MQSSRVSIIVPVYNGALTIRQCLASIQQQTYTAIEVIVVDDGSTDVTSEILSQYANIQVIHQKNSGAPVARNTGAACATGEFLLFCDADIILAPNFLSAMIDALHQHPECAYAYAQFNLGRKRFTSFPFDDQRLKTMPFIHTTSVMRRSVFPGFDVSLKRFQDWDLWLTLLEKNHRGYYIPQILFTIIRRGTISEWIPSFFFSLPWQTPAVKRYRKAEKIIKTKHGLSTP